MLQMAGSAVNGPHGGNAVRRTASQPGGGSDEARLLGSHRHRHPRGEHAEPAQQVLHDYGQDRCAGGRRWHDLQPSWALPRLRVVPAEGQAGVHLQKTRYQADALGGASALGGQAHNRVRLHDKDYQIPFKLTGKIDKLTIELEPPKLTAEDVRKLEEAEARQAADK